MKLEVAYKGIESNSSKDICQKISVQKTVQKISARWWDLDMSVESTAETSNICESWRPWKEWLVSFLCKLSHQCSLSSHRWSLPIISAKFNYIKKNTWFTTTCSRGCVETHGLCVFFSPSPFTCFGNTARCWVDYGTGPSTIGKCSFGRVDIKNWEVIDLLSSTAWTKNYAENKRVYTGQITKHGKYFEREAEKIVISTSGLFTFKNILKKWQFMTH